MAKRKTTAVWCRRAIGSVLLLMTALAIGCASTSDRSLAPGMSNVSADTKRPQPDRPRGRLEENEMVRRRYVEQTADRWVEEGQEHLKRQEYKQAQHKFQKAIDLLH